MPSVVSLVADERITLVVVDMIVLIVFDPAAVFIVVGDRGELVGTVLISDRFVDAAVVVVNIIGETVFSVERFSVADFKTLAMSVVVVAVNTTVDESELNGKIAPTALLYVCAVAIVVICDFDDVVESVDVDLITDVAVLEAEIVPSKSVKVTDAVLKEVSEFPIRMPVVVVSIASLVDGEVEGGRLTIDGGLNKVVSAVAIVVVAVIVVLVAT